MAGYKVHGGAGGGGGGSAEVTMGPDWGEAGKPEQDQQIDYGAVRVVAPVAEEQALTGLLLTMFEAGAPVAQDLSSLSQTVVAALGEAQACDVVAQMASAITQTQTIGASMTLAYQTAGTYSVTVPFASLLIGLQGGGEGGLNGTTLSGGNGGEGGSCSIGSVSGLTVGDTKQLVVGGAGASNGGNGGDSTWDTNVIVAKGGGTATANVGVPARTGGTGGNGATPGVGGGGGGGAGSSSNGSNGSGVTGGNGGTGTQAGGRGGNGGAAGGNNGISGTAPGGAGGGGASGAVPGNGGVGARGQALVRWFP